MKAFYESEREKENEVLSLWSGEYLYDAHFHQNIELLIVKRGGYAVTCNGERYEVRDGAIAFFDSYDVHSYDERIAGELEACVLLIPPSCFPSNTRKTAGMRPDCPVVQDATLASNLYEISDKLLREQIPANIRAATVPLLLALIDEKLNYTPDDRQAESSLFRRLLDYIQTHFKEPISLSSAAKHFGYTQSYLSRAFHGYVNVGFREYVNGLRLQYVEQNIGRGKNIGDLVFEAGFGSLQTYYRQKAKQKS
ncbi:MAG: helix-turn-helix transcriptional regulator [Clostridia bacterium]|nr:helix-turn-helix transcriptional regulator [Clostridia bacterium]